MIATLFNYSDTIALAALAIGCVVLAVIGFVSFVGWVRGRMR